MSYMEPHLYIDFYVERQPANQMSYSGCSSTVGCLSGKTNKKKRLVKLLIVR